MSRIKVRLKIWGPEEGVRKFLRDLDENYLAVISNVKPSNEGGVHAYATLNLEGKEEG